MNARDDMEVDLDTMRDVYMTKAQREAYERICAQALVERAGEPVVEPMYAAMIEADFEHNVVTFEMRGEYVCAAGLYEIRPHTAPAAPGASHEL